MKKKLLMMLFSLICYTETVNAIHSNVNTSFLDFMQNVFKATTEIIADKSIERRNQAKPNLVAESNTQQTNPSLQNHPSQQSQYTEQSSEVYQGREAISR